MLSVVEYETEFALFGVPALAMERFPKSEGWNRVTIGRLSGMGKVFSDFADQLISENEAGWRKELLDAEHEGEAAQDEIAELETKVADLERELDQIKSEKSNGPDNQNQGS